MIDSQKHAVEKHFDQVADVYFSFYEGSSSEAHSFTIRLARVIEMLPEKFDILTDIGCGPGLLLDKIFQKRLGGKNPSPLLLGMDFSSNMAAQAKDRLSRNSLKNNWLLVNANAESLPFRSNSADVVICMGLMEYLDDELKVLGEISRILRLGGSAIITLPNLHSPYRSWHRLLNNFFSRLSELFPENQKLQKVEFMVGPFTKGVKHREYDRRYYEKLVKKFGLQAVAVCYYNFKLFLTPLDKWFPGLTVRYSRILEKFGRNSWGQFMATAFIIKVRKNG